MFRVQMAVMTIGQFIRDEMKRRDIASGREFGKLSGVPATIINELRNDKPRELELGTLAKLSDFTGVSLMTLLALTYPDAVTIDIDVETRLDAERISKLPPNKKAIARDFIAGAYTKGSDE